MTEINLTPTATLLQIDLTSFSSKSQEMLPARSWGAPAQSNAAIVLVHGLGAHSGWFEPLAGRLKEKNIFILSFDLTGFGKQKDRHFYSYKQWLDNTSAAFAHMQSIMTDKPIFLLGNSMGALIALQSVALKSIKPSGLILTSPAFAGHPKIFTLSYQLRQLFQAILKPDSEAELPFGADLITTQEKIKTWLDKDQDRRRFIPRRMLLDLFFLTLSLRRHKINIDCPLLMVDAGMDRLVDNQVNELIFKQITADHKKKVTLLGAAHDLPLDPAVEQLSDLLFNWMNSTINQNRLAII